MKKNTFASLSALSGIVILLASCSSVRQNTAFNEQKYTNFRHRNPVVALNHQVSNNDKHALVSVAPKQNTTISQVVSEKPVTASSTPIIHKTQNTNTNILPPNPPVVASNNGSVSNAVPNNSLKGISYAPAPVNEMAPTNTTGGGGNSSIDPILLVILAILVAPLAVFLYDNKATTRFWIDLILWLLGVGAVGFIFLGILWLVAVIYAILIVTGHA